MNAVTHTDECGDDVLKDLADDMEAVAVVLAQDVGAHKGEHRHDVVQQVFLQTDRQTDICEIGIGVPTFKQSSYTF